MAQGRIRLMVVNDHPAVLRGLCACLSFEPDLAVVGTASSGEQAVDLAAELHPDVVLMDRSMPGIGGIEATRRLVEAQPDTRVMILCAAGGAERKAEVLASGAMGYVLVESSPSQIASLLRDLVRSS